MTNADIVIRIARRTLGNPAKRAAKSARDAAIARIASACQRGETTEVLQAEVDLAKAEYLRMLRAPTEA